jgi:hypothetical protein
MPAHRRRAHPGSGRDNARSLGIRIPRTDVVNTRQPGPMSVTKAVLRLAVASCCVLLVGAPAAPAIADVQSNRIHVEYVPPTNPLHQPVHDMLKERRALEKLKEIFSPFQLPIALALRIVGCDGVSNAWYQRPTVSICYEYLDEIRKHMPTEVTPAGIAPADAVVGQFFYAVAHEMGHAVFDLLDVPVFGRTEDAADQFATYIMLQFGKESARRLITGAAYSYQKYVKNPTVTVPLAAFSDAHGAPAQRFYNLLCIAYGADSALFADFVKKDYLPNDRAKGCTKEYGEVTYAFHRLIGPHLDKQLAKDVLHKAWLPAQIAKPTP